MKEHTMSRSISQYEERMIVDAIDPFECVHNAADDAERLAILDALDNEDDALVIDMSFFDLDETPDPYETRFVIATVIS